MSEITSAPSRCLGRAPRAFDPTIPHLSTMRMMVSRVPPPPDAVHWASDLAGGWGMMLNDRLGCCTLAAAYHLMQVWSAHGRERVLTEADPFVEQAYREFAGYDGTPATDRGAVEQDILRQWLQTGVPIAEGTEDDPRPGRSRLLFYGEVDPRNLVDVCRAIHDCGGVYVGFEVPAWLMETDPLPQIWYTDVNLRSPAGDQIVGGHAVSLIGYDNAASTFDVLSWGTLYQMSFAFFRRYVDEVYALSHPWWVDATGRTPLGLSPRQLEALVAAQLHGRVATR
jgi:hypothetical protein